jgi:hypothetical protein
MGLKRPDHRPRGGFPMTTATQIHLDPAHSDLLRSLAEQTGKPADEVVQEGLDLVAERLRLEERRRVFERAFGIWKDRDDLPDFEADRREWNDRVDRMWGTE